MSNIDLNDSENFITQNLTEEAKKALNDMSKWRIDSPDRPPCAICGETIDRSVPIRMWTQNIEKEISFHTFCAFKNFIIPKSCEYCKNWDPREGHWEADCKLNKFPHPNPYEDDWSPTPDMYCCDDFKDFREKKG